MKGKNMNQKYEIERRFLLTGSVPTIQVIRKERITQAYLLTDPSKTIRIRLVEAEGEEMAAYITVKGKTTNFSRREIETDLDSEIAKQLIEEFRESGLVVKTRLTIETPRELTFIEKALKFFGLKEPAGEIWYVDLFEDVNAGLNVAEIELKSEDQKFTKPSWVGEEITHDHRYSNSNLSKAPWLTWKDNPKCGTKPA